MKGFSVARAFSAGVDLIERKPWTLVWWAAAIILLELAPRFILPLLGDGAGTPAAVAPIGQFSQAAPPDFMTIVRQFQQTAFNHAGEAPMTYIGWLLWGCFFSAVLYNAAFRAVLEPKDSAFGYLRVGVAEFWQTLVLLTVLAGIVVYVIAVVFLTIFVALACSALAQPWSNWGMVAYFVALAMATYWIMLRLSLGSVMTFADKRYRLFHSWSATRSSVWQLFWTGFLTFALVIGLYALFIVSIVMVFLPAGTVWAGIAQLAPGLASLQPTNGAVSAGLVVWMVAVALISAVARAITLAPWAAAYREIKGEPS